MSGGNCDVLLIGCEGTGKSLLLRQLNNMCKSEPDPEVSFATVVTSGMELKTIVTPKKQKIVFREIGGSFVLVWPNYFDTCKMVIYMVDMSNGTQISETCLEFLRALDAPKLKGKPILLLLNKMDMSNTMPRPIFDSLMHLDDIINSASQQITVDEISATNPKTLHVVLKWITERSKQGK